MRPRFGCSAGVGGGDRQAAGRAADGGRWVVRAGPAGLVTVILISSRRTPSIACTARAGLAHQRGGILGREQEGEAHPARRR